MEFFIVGGAEMEAAVDGVEEHDSGAALGVDGSGEPDVVGDVGGDVVER